MIVAELLREKTVCSQHSSRVEQQQGLENDRELAREQIHTSSQQSTGPVQEW